jgi:hypothetical protein
MIIIFAKIQYFAIILSIYQGLKKVHILNVIPLIFSCFFFNLYGNIFKVIMYF